jgi:hypothetical protein
MKTLKIGLENIQGRLSRIVMKKIMAGSNNVGPNPNQCNHSCASEPNDCNGGCSCHGTAPWRYCS